MQKCYTSLVEDLHIDDVECLKYSLSKGLGIGIVAGGSIMKIPQLITSKHVLIVKWTWLTLAPVLSSGSARGLSLPANVLETLSYAITLAYSVRNNFPFSTYGENAFLTLQNILISLLVSYLSGARSLSKPLGILALFGASAFVLNSATLDLLGLLQLSTLPLSLASKLPQIAQNARARGVGQLSAFAVFSQLLGSLARLFTTMSEVGDTRMAAGFGLACALNAVLAYQVLAYGSGPARVPVQPVPVNIPREEKTGSILNEKGTGAIQWGAEAPGSRPALPPSVESTGQTRAFGSPKKWARKLD